MSFIMSLAAALKPVAPGPLLSLLLRYATTSESPYSKSGRLNVDEESAMNPIMEGLAQN